jgi:predicted phosphodiesterase
VIPLTDEDRLLLETRSGKEYEDSGGILSNRQARHRRQYLKRNGHEVTAWQGRAIIPFVHDEDPGPIGEAPDDWSNYFNELEEAALVYQGVHACEERTLEIKYPDNLPVALVCVGDFHFGNKGVRYDLINRDMELIEATEGTVAIGMGDYVDNFKVNSKAASGLYGAIEPNPEYQQDWASRKMGVVTKWAGLVDGNHDDRNYQAAGLSSSTIAIAKTLGVPAFSQAGVGVKMQVGAQSYFAILKHNFRGNSGLSKGNEARRMWDEWPWHWENADLVCLAHTHEPHVEIPQRKGRPVVYARSGTYKQGDSYAEMKGYRSGYGPSFFVLYPDKHLIVPLPQESFVENVEIYKGIRARYTPR